MQEKNYANPIFSERLKLAISSKSLTQNKLASLINIRQTSISEYINGKTTPSAEKLSQISQALGVTMDWLWGVNDPSNSSEKIQTTNLEQAKQEINRLKNKLKAATKTLDGAFTLAMEALKLEE